MKHSKALKIILIAWALNFFRTEEMEFNFVKPGGTGPGSVFFAAWITWFGTTKPDEETQNRFEEVYRDWMLAISGDLEEILLGETSVDEILIDQVTKETWL